MMGYTKGLALLFMLVIILAYLSPSDAWWGRRRRRRKPSCHVPAKPVGKHWANNYDGQMHFQCPYAQSISSLFSIYSTCHKDRVWSFRCSRNIAATGGCYWRHNVNTYDGLLQFHCQSGHYSGFITAIRSVHSNHHEDRKYSFRCCSNKRFATYQCKTGYYQNVWRGTLDYHVPHGFYLTGVSSYHDNRQEDRRWKFRICRIKRRYGGRDEANVDEIANSEEGPDTEDNADKMDPAENREEEVTNAENENREEEVANAEDENREEEVANAEDENTEEEVANNAENENTEENMANAEE